MQAMHALSAGAGRSHGVHICTLAARMPEAWEKTSWVFLLNQGRGQKAPEPFRRPLASLLDSLSASPCVPCCFFLLKLRCQIHAVPARHIVVAAAGKHVSVIISALARKKKETLNERHLNSVFRPLPPFFPAASVLSCRLRKAQM